jgi:hypothetical protein
MLLTLINVRKEFHMEVNRRRVSPGIHISSGLPIHIRRITILIIQADLPEMFFPAWSIGLWDSPQM